MTRLAGQSGGSGYVDATGAAARFDNPNDIAVDAGGNVYVADLGAFTIRRVTPAGVVSTFAGRAGEPGSANGRGGAARFQWPSGLGVDPSGNVFVADTNDHTVRKISPAGVVRIFATVTLPVDVATDSAGNVYVSSFAGIRKLTPSGAFTTMYSTAEFLQAQKLVFDASDNLYFTTPTHVRRMTAAGVVSTIAAVSNRPEGLAVTDAGDLYVAEFTGSRIVKITPDGTVSSFAGQAGVVGSADGTGANARFNVPTGVAIAPGGQLYVCDARNASVRSITIPGAVVTTLAGTYFELTASADGPPDDARFNFPFDATVDSAGNVVVSTHGAIRKIAAGGVVSTFVSSNSLSPTGIAIADDDTLYVANRDYHTIGTITPGGVVSILAGVAHTPGTADGTGSGAQFNQPFDVVLHPSGDLYVTDAGNHTIRRVTTAGEVTTFAGLAGQSGSTDATGSAARFYAPAGITVDDSGNLYVVDRHNYTIRKITVPDAVVTTFAGAAGYLGQDDGTGISARFWFPSALTFDGGNLYVVEIGRLRRINAAAEVTTVAGVASRNASVDGTGSFARIVQPDGIGSDGAGNLYVADLHAGNIRHARLPGIADAATVSTSTPPVNTAVQLDTTPSTATSWQWSIFRRPTGSVAELWSATTRNPTFTPDVADLFVLLLRAESASGVRYSTVELTPTGCDPIANVVATISSPSMCMIGSGVSASVAVDGGGTLSYQWGWRTTSGGAITPISGAQSSSYSLDGDDFAGAGTYYLVATVTPACGPAVVSNQLLVTLTAPPGAEISASSGVFANSIHNYASVPDAGAGATYAWTVTNGSINSGQGTRNIEYTAGASGAVSIDVVVTRGGCSPSGNASVPIMERAPGAVLLYTVTPCRVFDTRVTAPALASNATQTVAVTGVCGIPSSAKAVAINMTAVGPGGMGWLTVFPADAALPATSTLNYAPGKTRANNAIVPLSTLGELKVFNYNSNASATHFIIDIVGYYE